MTINRIFISLQDDDIKDETKIDPKNMKVAELRAELESRGLSSKGKIYDNHKSI
jgi:hypothetical protein